jgi:hypothetical protein
VPLTDKVSFGYVSHFFLFSLAKPALVREKLSNKRLFFARSQLCQPLHAHGAPTG